MDLLQNVWMLPLVYMLVVIMNVVLAYMPILRLAKCPEDLKVWFALGMFASNVLALPLLVLPSLCGQISFETSLLGDTRVLEYSECLIVSETYLVMNVLLQQFLYWVLVVPFVRRGASEGGDSRPADQVPEGSVEDAQSSQSVPSIVQQGNSVAAVADESEDLQELGITNGEEGQVGLTEESVKETRKIDDETRWIWLDYAKSFARNTFVALTKPAVLSQIVGATIGLIPELSVALFSPEGVLEPLGTAVKSTAAGVAPLVNFAMSATLGLQLREMTWRDMRNPTDELGIQHRTYAVYVIGRMIILPGINFGFLYLLQDYLLPKDRLVRLLLYSILATPSANLNVVIANILGNHRAASFMAKGAFYQYVIGVVAFALYLFLAVLVSEEVA